MISTAERVLSATNLKRQHDGSYRGNSPLRADSDSQAFWLKIDDGEHGVYKDHVSNDSGSLYELARALGIEPNIDKETGRVIVDNSKQGYKNLDEYAQFKGVTIDVFKAANWRDEIVEGRAAIVFPTANGERVRFIDGDKSKVVYRAMNKGYSTCWYGLSRALAMALNNGLPLVLANGEASVVVAQSKGIPAFSGTGGEGNISELMLEELKSKWQSKILIALDCDKKGNEASQKIATLLGDNAVVIDLGLSDKGDLADFCKLHSEHSVVALKRLFETVSSNSDGSTHKQENSDAITLVSLDSLMTKMDKFLYEDRSLLGRVIKMPFNQLRKMGGFSEMITTGKVWLIGNRSGGGKTIFSECLTDGFTSMGYNVIYIGDEWKPEELALRAFHRANPSNEPTTYMDFLRYAEGSEELREDGLDDIALSKRAIRSRRGKVHYVQINNASGTIQSQTYLEHILSTLAIKIAELKAVGQQIDIVILDYLSLYGTGHQANNVEELKVDMFKSFCKLNDVLGISTTQINKSAEDKVADGKLIQSHDLYFIRPDKGNLISSMNAIYKTRFEVFGDMSEKRYDAAKDSDGNLYPTPNLGILNLKNSVASSNQMALFHFDWAHMRIVEGLHQDYYFNQEHGIVMEREEIKALRKAKQNV